MLPCGWNEAIFSIKNPNKGAYFFWPQFVDLSRIKLNGTISIQMVINRPKLSKDKAHGTERRVFCYDYIVQFIRIPELKSYN